MRALFPKLIKAVLTITIFAGCSTSETGLETSTTTSLVQQTTTTEIKEPETLLALCNLSDGFWDTVSDFDTSPLWGGTTRPSVIGINNLSPCDADGYGDIVEIYEWTTWSKDLAIGVGRFGENTFEPNAAAENYKWTEITVTLDTPVNGFFTEMRCEGCWKPYVGPVSRRLSEMFEGYPALRDGNYNHGEACEFEFQTDFPFHYCDDGPFIEYIQSRLSELGYPNDELYYPTEDDGFGVFGFKTWLAVMQFQIDKQIESEMGWVDKVTWRELFAGIKLPGNDLDNDGMISPNEIPFD